MDITGLCLSGLLLAIVALVITAGALNGRVTLLRRQRDELAAQNRKLREQNNSVIALASDWQARALHAQRRADRQEPLGR
jgi:cell division protein FtsB